MYQDDYSSITSDFDSHTIQVIHSERKTRMMTASFSFSQIYLSVFYAHNKLGAAFYDSSSAIIYFIPDVEETLRFDITQQSRAIFFFAKDCFEERMFVQFSQIFNHRSLFVQQKQVMNITKH